MSDNNIPTKVEDINIKPSRKQPTRINRICHSIGKAKSIIILIGTPIIASPLIWLYTIPSLADRKHEFRCIFMILCMAVYWTTECIPLPVTSLMPMFLVPLLGIMESSEITMIYFKDTNVMAFGALIMALAIEKWNIHRRVAFRVMLFCGAEPKWLMLGIMLPTWFLSMWISNTASSAMMITMVQAIIEQIKKTSNEGQDYPNEIRSRPTETSLCENGTTEEFTIIENDNRIPKENDNNNPVHQSVEISQSIESLQIERERKRIQNRQAGLEKCLKLSICYSATVGGIATLTGSPTNLIMQNEADLIFAKHKVVSPLSFGSWFAFAFPASLMCLLLAWIWLQISYLGFTSILCWKHLNTKEQNAKIIREEYHKLGPIKFGEIMTMICFVILALLWLTRSPGFVPGWSDLFISQHERLGKIPYAKDATAAVIISFALFILPATNPFRRASNGSIKYTPSKPLLEWKLVSTNMPWGIIFLLGGGFAMADTAKESGLSCWIGQGLVEIIGEITPWIMVAVVSIFVACLTEVTSNLATASLLIPILADVGVALELNPLYIVFPAILACSFAFMLPVATPPNAVVFSYGGLRVLDMIKSGFAMNLICVLVVTVAVNTWGMAIFDLTKLPWPVTNTTGIDKVTC